VDPRTGAVTELFDGPIALGTPVVAYTLDRSRDGRVVAFVAESGSRPPDVWVADGGWKALRQVTDLHPGVSRLPLGDSRLVEWTDDQGRNLRGALLLPAGYRSGTRSPLVVRVYGGSMGSERVYRFGLESGIDNGQLLATRGYAVLYPDTPTRIGTPMQDIASAVRAGVDAVVDLGVADPDRVAVIGQSYGGYSALAVAVCSDHLRAVISSAGFSNLFSQYTEMRADGSAFGVAWAEQDQGRMGGHPWEVPAQYHDNSPFFFLDRVTAPVLLIHGGDDHVVPPQRSQETFVALRRLGKRVDLVLYDGEGHHPGSWSVENATDYWERIFDWLDEHLAARPQPESVPGASPAGASPAFQCCWRSTPPLDHELL